MEEIEVLKIIENHYSGKSPILLSSDLVKDLNIDGDDADELFEELLSHHQIELPLKRLNNCFHSEGELLDFLYIPKQVLYKLGLRSNPALRSLEPFTVKNIIELFANESI